MIVLPLLWQVPKTFHQKFLFPALGHYHVDLDLSVLSVSTCCALKHFFPQSSSKRLFYHTSGGTFRIIIAYQKPSLLVLKIYGKANFLKMLIDVDHDNLRTVLLQTPNTFHSYPFQKSRIPLFHRST